MCAFVHNLFLHTRQSIEDDCAGSAFHIIESCLAERDADEDWHRPLRNGVEYVGCSHLDNEVAMP
jgi:hypothetical protein